MTFVIAECCVNFRDLAEATQMIREAAAAGADACKFQCYRPEDVAAHPRAEELERIALGEGQLLYLKHACANHKIEFMCTPMFPGAIQWLKPLVKRWKIRYHDRNDAVMYALLKHDPRPILVSCSGRRDTVFVGRRESKRNIIPMICTPEYPPKELYMPARFGETEGFSSHYPIAAVPLEAAKRGAQFIEVHVKLDNYSPEWLPIDDAVSLSMCDLKSLVYHIRTLDKISEGSLSGDVT